MLALEEYRASRCMNCGGDMDETTAAENEDNYETLPPIQCYRCVQFDRASIAYEKQPYPRSFMHRVDLRKRGE